MKYDPYQILLSPVMTESVFELIEKENKIVFTCHRKSTKTQIKQAIEELFEVKVEKVNSNIQPGGIKRVYIKLTEDYSAMDLAMQLGMF
ncbi:MAG: 50S ribosomal protein L23 [Candidatus Thorarchaeota archaeon]